MFLREAQSLGCRRTSLACGLPGRYSQRGSDWHLGQILLCGGFSNRLQDRPYSRPWSLQAKRITPQYCDNKNAPRFQVLSAWEGTTFTWETFTFIPPINVYQVPCPWGVFGGEEWGLKWCHKTWQQAKKLWAQRGKCILTAWNVQAKLSGLSLWSDFKESSRFALQRSPFIGSVRILIVISLQAPCLFPLRIHFFAWKMETIVISFLPPSQSWFRRKHCGVLCVLSNVAGIGVWA